MHLPSTPILVVTFLLGGTRGLANPRNPTVTIDAGVVIGTVKPYPASQTGVNEFLGIPFGVAERFSTPRKVRSWAQPLDATSFKPACIQQFAYPEAYRKVTQDTFNTPAPEESEDCLYLNVLAPRAPGKGRAVLVWIFGGALQFGHGGFPAYDGSAFAAREDIVYVSFNYRTNVFGFPSSPDLPIEGRNLGFLDQRLALDWIQRNIHFFGGDPNKVTVFGESAGSLSVDALLTSFPERSRPPFHAAILQSGQISYRWNPSPNQLWPDTSSSWNTLVALLNCTSNHNVLECVNNTSASSIKDIIEKQSLFFHPVYDNITFNAEAARNRVTGNIAKVPTLSGTNAQEGRFLVQGQGNVTAYLDGVVGDSMKEARKKIEEAYSVGGQEFPTSFDAIAQMETDGSWQCPAAIVANETAMAGIPSWRYYFNASFPNTQQYPGEGVYHSSEISIVFGTYPKVNVTAQQFALHNYMRAAWARFAKDPIAGPGWNAVGTGADYDGGLANYDLDLGVLGSEDGGGVKIVRQREVDVRCELWRPFIKYN